VGNKKSVLQRQLERYTQSVNPNDFKLDANDPFFRSDLKPVQNTWPSKLNHWKLAGALSGFEFNV